MKEETKNVRRIIIRRNGTSGATGTGTGTDASDGIDGNSTSTIGSRNVNDSIGNSSDGNAHSRDDRKQSEGMHNASGSEVDGVRSDGSSARTDDDALDFGGFASDSNNDRGTASGGTKPKRTYRKRQSAKASLALDGDTEDVKNIVVAIGDAGANATGFEGFKVHEVEALTIAKPAARILQRHGAVAETIRTVADPLSLIIATATVFGPRIVAYKAMKDAGMLNQTPAEAAPQTFAQAVQPETKPTAEQNEEKFTRVDSDLFTRFQGN